MDSSLVEHKVKIIILGDSAVGKTSFIECFKEGVKPTRITIPTTGPEYVTHKFIRSNSVLKVSLWDTAGQETYRAINKTFYRDSKGGLILVDISQAPHKESLEFWYHEFKTHGDAKAQIMLVGNKADLEKDQDTVALLEDFAKSKQIPYLEVSALTGFNVDKAMENVIDMIFDKYYKGVENTSASFLDIRKSKEYSRSIRLGESVYSQKEEDPASSSCCKSV